MKTLLAFLSTALFASALTAQAAPPIPISSVPFTISAPGTYALISNLTYNSTDSNSPTAITINVSSGGGGGVILDLQGFTITRDVNTAFTNFGVVVKSSNATVRNGKIQGFDTGMLVGDFSGFVAPHLSNIRITNITFANSLRHDLHFSQVDSSMADNCKFIVDRSQSLTEYAIRDSDTQIGNRYVNNYFDGRETNRIAVEVFAGNFPITVSGPPIILDRCQFAPPPTP